MIVACSKCGKEYKLEPDESPSDFQCVCGGELHPAEVPSKKPDNLGESPKLESPKSESPKPESSGSIFDNWKKQYLIVIGIVVLVFILIAIDSAALFGDLVIINITAPSTGENSKEIIIPNTIKNNGILPTGDFNVTFQFTPEKNSKNIIFIGKIRVSDLASGETKNQDTKFTLPNNITTGKYYIRVVVDSDKEIIESNESNNEVYSSTPIYII